ncbi:MAG: 16S rRNA (cytosine(1402)-N(4))-methyltransferase RsmH [Cyanobacteria bacterium REEB67]|nr:16S rRNA (cytosine(1402)-N(4))-methyltransferase RsmH [Cyanobacteria bacterium REEB67]
MLNVRPGLTYVDATAGAGGHLSAIYNAAGGAAKVVGIDQDPASLEALRKRAPDDITLLHSNFRYLKETLAQSGINTVDGGILADLGVSSMQIDRSERGFSFQKDGPLDMRMDTTQSLSAYDIVNGWKEEALANIIFEYGEERYSRRIARRILEARPIKTTLELSEIVSRCVPRGSDKKSRKNFSKESGGEGGAGQRMAHSAIHPATRTFQALRMAVNEELPALKEFLQESLSILEPGARLVLITFHSLEDRVVKQFFKQAALSCVCPPRMPQCACNKHSELEIITRKPLTASSQEILANTRSRSAKLRAGQKLI